MIYLLYLPEQPRARCRLERAHGTATLTSLPGRRAVRDLQSRISVGSPPAPSRANLGGRGNGERSGGSVPTRWFGPATARAVDTAVGGGATAVSVGGRPPVAVTTACLAAHRGTRYYGVVRRREKGNRCGDDGAWR